MVADDAARLSSQAYSILRNLFVVWSKPDSLQAFRRVYGYLRRLPCHASRFSLDNRSRSNCIATGPASTDPVRTDRPARLNPLTPAEFRAVDGSYCLPHYFFKTEQLSSASIQPKVQHSSVAY